MKKLLRLSTVFFLIASSLLFNTCSIFEKDPCDGTDLGLSSLSVNLMISTLFHQNEVAVPGLEVKIEFYKVPCGDKGYKPGSEFTFTGFTDSGGMFNSGKVGYNLRNSKDEILVYNYYKGTDGTWLLAEVMSYTSSFFSEFTDRTLQYSYKIN
ncbi:MAG: hypothetical protein EOM73_02370 [Bacteroidia bacterium]|nr:hypothetical protein [Bacteroidia bacterium]